MRVRVSLALLPVLAAPLMLLPQVPATAVATTVCGDGSGYTRTYPQRRQFVDAQGWWRKNLVQPANSTTQDSGHVHLGACIPEKEQVSGTFSLYIKAQMHDHAGEFNQLKVTAKGEGYENTVAELFPRRDVTYLDPQLQQPAPAGRWQGSAHGTQVRWFKVTFDVARDFQAGGVRYGGLQEIRLRGFTTATDGNLFSTSMIFQVYVGHATNAGYPVNNTTPYDREPFLRAKGFYNVSTGEDNTRYCESTLRDKLPTGTVARPWRPAVAVSDHATGEPDTPVTGHNMYLDRNAHADEPGFAIREGTGDYPAINPDSVKGQPTFAPVPAYPANTVAAGDHKLMIKADCDMDKDLKFPHNPKFQATLSGVLVIPFTAS